MNNCKLTILSFLILSLTTFVNHSFNVSYHGNDAEISYETSWGKERFIKEDYIKYFPYYTKYIETINILNAYTINIKSLPQPYCQLEQLFCFQNWGMYFNSEYIKKIFEHNNIVNAIEIGSFYGLSTRHIASLLPEHGKLYAIDTWEYHKGMYEQFLSNIILTGLTSKVIPIKKRSDQAINDVLAYTPSFDLIFVDGDHETEAVLNDLEFYYPLLSKHGVICGDDWLLSSVRAAVVQFAQQNQLTIYGACNFWFLRDEGTYQQKTFIDADESIWIFNK
ncbi:class I SAM-dependent methyltransferase [Candidatus Babeliales bacterium]|nr:class I SAM-dependent methyltransferase [Candidatus Babeliales bacterium]